MSALTATLLATIGVSLLSLVGLLVTSMRVWTATLELQLLSFAAAVLITTSLLSLLPEALERADGKPVLTATLVAIVGFYLLERALDNARAVENDHHVRPGHASNARYLILLGDSVHNFVDGVVIAVAFMISPATGLSTTLAVAAHELPHEIGDFAILVRSGLPKATALALNLLTALTAVLGGLAAFTWRTFVMSNLTWLIAAAAGMFLYIAMVNLIPEVQHSGHGRHGIQTLPFLCGVTLIVLIGALLPHEDASHSAGAGDHLAAAVGSFPAAGLGVAVATPRISPLTTVGEPLVK